MEEKFSPYPLSWEEKFAYTHPIIEKFPIKNKRSRPGDFMRVMSERERASTPSI
jgi:hypothetical protein